jgi:hypothetical protein
VSGGALFKEKKPSFDVMNGILPWSFVAILTIVSPPL